jgi:hypothetical protein
MAEVAIGAGQGVGTGVGAWACFRFVRWLVEFIFKRLDIRSARMDAREQALEARYDNRLSHLETELSRTQRAMTLLLNDTARRDPSNPVLQRVAELLHPVIPTPENDPSLNHLAQQAGEALDAAH